MTSASNMNDCYERVIAVLGKGEDDPLFLQLMRDLGEMPEIISCPPQASEYMFSEAGLAIHYEPTSSCFVAASFHGESAGVRAGRVKRYAGPLAGELEFGNSRGSVEEKLGCRPKASRVTAGEIYDEYDLKPLELHCKFDAEERLAYLSVWYIPGCYWRAKS